MDMKEVERNNVVTVRQRESEMFINESYLLQKLYVVSFCFTKS